MDRPPDRRRPVLVDEVAGLVERTAGYGHATSALTATGAGGILRPGMGPM